MSFIRIPNSIIVDRDINSREFMLYAVLKWQLKMNESVLVLRGSELKDLLRWEDSRTMKKYLQLLEDKGYIKQLTSFRADREVEIRIKENKGASFSQIPIRHFQRIYYESTEVEYKGKPRDMTDSTLRLYYFYEKNYSYERGRAFPSYENIKKNLSLNYSYIAVINKHLEELGVLKVMRGKTQNKNGRGSYSRKNNSYIPLIRNRM